MSSSRSEKEEEAFSWTEWFFNGLTAVVDVSLGLTAILGVLVLEYFSGIAVKFDFSKNSPEIGYMIAGVIGGAITVSRSAKRRLRIEQEVSARLADALPDDAEV